MLLGRRRQPKPAFSPGSRLLARESLLGPRHQASPPGQSRTAAEGPSEAADGSLNLRKHTCGSAAPFPVGSHADARSEREPASEGGGRVGVGPGLLRRPPSSESHGGAHSSSRLAPTTPTHSSSDEPHRWCRASPPEGPPETVVPTRQPSRRGWAHPVPGRRGGGRSGACAAPPALPGSRGCRQRSTSARWRPSRSAPPCPGAGCRRG
jgi:hypothetical protein